MPEFRVGDPVIFTDGHSRSIRKIDGVRRGNIRVGRYLFDWCGNEVDASNYERCRIEPLLTK